MRLTVIYDERASELRGADVEGEGLWLGLDEVGESTGWELKPEGVCRGDVCVPIPAGRQEEFLRGGERLNLAAFARLRGQPVVHDEARSVWLFGEAARVRSDALLSLQAPDFTLPDLEGRPYSLWEFRGKKVLLVSWASW